MSQVAKFIFNNPSDTSHEIVLPFPIDFMFSPFPMKLLQKYAVLFLFHF